MDKEVVYEGLVSGMRVLGVSLSERTDTTVVFNASPDSKLTDKDVFDRAGEAFWELLGLELKINVT